jgi:hypothetical protein
VAQSKEEFKEEAREWKRWHRMGPRGSGGAIYFFGLVGSLIYFIQHATTFADGILGLIKAVAWPAVVIYKVLEQFHL